MHPSFTRYKDADPLIVIGRVRRILTEQLGLLPIESWLNSLEGFYSLNLRCARVPIFSNGKGATRELALASAYGEFMERLQNLILYDTMRFAPDDLRYKGFFHAPDERLMSLEEVLDDPGITALFPGGIQPGERERILRALAGMTPPECPADFIALPFMNIRSGNVEHVPLPFLRVFYGSNGMCAGSTPAEALVQGLCEVLERYVNREIIQRRIAAPSVPEGYLSGYPEQYEMLQRIRGSRACRVTIKDCSLGQGYPVVGLTYIDTAKHAYFVKFGAHPAFEIALERALTELLQGRDLNTMTDLTEFCYYRADADPSKNLADIFAHGSGRYPAEFFSTEGDYAFAAFPRHNSNDNSSFLAYLLKITGRDDRAVLVRDVSFLGFPAFHAIIPGLSEICAFDPEEVERVSTMASARALISARLCEAGPDELRGIVSTLKGNYFTNADSIAQLVNAPVGDSFPWKDIKTDLFCSMIHFRLGEPGKAHEHMKRFVSDIEADPPIIGYYRCARDYLGMVADGYPTNKAERILEGIYGREPVTEVMSDLGDPEQAFRYLGKLTCWNCSGCTHTDACSYAELRRLHRSVKDRYSLNGAGHSRERHLFSDSIEACRETNAMGDGLGWIRQSIT